MRRGVLTGSSRLPVCYSAVCVRHDVRCTFCCSLLLTKLMSDTILESETRETECYDSHRKGSLNRTESGFVFRRQRDAPDVGSWAT
jgi:hypothetical protein